MKSLIVIIIIVMTITVPSVHSRLQREVVDWYDPSDITYLSDADFELASVLSLDEFQERMSPYEDPEAQHNNVYYEGDMMIKADDEKKVAMFMAKRWPGGRIPYLMENKFSQEERAAIARGIMTLQEETCIKFVPKEEHDEDFVLMRKEKGCAAHVGRIGGQQWLILGQGCFHFETVVHELMHSVGFIHEQSRPDRDNYVKIMWDNIKDGAKRNFRKHTTDYLADAGFPYDLMSVMHYRQYAFSKNRKPTIVPRKTVPYLRCRGLECPSEMDLKKINYLYKCKDGKSEVSSSNTLSKNKRKRKWSHKKGFGGTDKFDKNLNIGRHFYETNPYFNEHKLGRDRNHGHRHRHERRQRHRDAQGMPPIIEGPSHDPDEHEEFSSDYENNSPGGPCVGDHCYNSYDHLIDRNMPGETQLTPAVLPAPNVQEQNKNEGGFYSWLSHFIHW